MVFNQSVSDNVRMPSNTREKRVAAKGGEAISEGGMPRLTRVKKRGWNYRSVH
jgi:hypothetical protein